MKLKITCLAALLTATAPQFARADFVRLADEPAGRNHEPEPPDYNDTTACEPTHFVSTSGDDQSGDGSRALPWRTIQKALDEVDPGACIRVPGNVEPSVSFVETVQSSKDGTPAKPITVQCDGAFAGWTKPPSKPRDTGYRTPLVSIQHNYHRILGCDLYMNGSAGYAVNVSDGVVGTIIAFNSIHGVRDCDGSGAGSGGVILESDVRGVYIFANEIFDNFKKNAGEDTQTCPDLNLQNPSQAQCTYMKSHHDHTSDADGIRIEDGASVVQINANWIYNNSGDGIQVNGTSDDLETMPHDIMINNNEIFNDSTCHGWTENAVDLKKCHTIRLSSMEAATKGSTFSQHFYNFYPTSRGETTLTHGEAVVVHAGATAVTIEKTRISNVCRGVAAGQIGLPVSDMSIRRLWIAQNLDGSMASPCSGMAAALQLSNVEGVEINNNTITDHLERGVVVNSERTEGPGDEVVEFWNNVVDFNGGSEQAVNINIDETNFATDHNLYSEKILLSIVNVLPPPGTESDIDWWRGQSQYADPYSVNHLGATPELDGDGAHNTSGAPGVNEGIYSDRSGTAAAGGQLDVGYLECF